MQTVRKRNISGVDLEVAVLGYAVVKAGEEVDLPVNYEWHTKDDPAPVGYSPEVWEDVKPSRSSSSNK